MSTQINTLPRRNTLVSVLMSFLRSIIDANDDEILKLKQEIGDYRLILEFISESDEPHHKIKQIAKTALLKRCKL